MASVSAQGGGTLQLGCGIQSLARPERVARLEAVFFHRAARTSSKVDAMRRILACRTAQSHTRRGAQPRLSKSGSICMSSTCTGQYILYTSIFGIYTWYTQCIYRIYVIGKLLRYSTSTRKYFRSKVVLFRNTATVVFRTRFQQMVCMHVQLYEYS